MTNIENVCILLKIFCFYFTMQAKTEEVLHFPWILLSEDQRIVDLNGSEYSDGNIILLEQQSTGPGLETCEHDYPPEMVIIDLSSIWYTCIINVS